MGLGLNNDFLQGQADRRPKSSFAHRDKMITGMKVDDLLQESIYQSGEREETYFNNLAFLDKHISEQAVAEYARQNPSRAGHAFADLLWWVMDEAYPAFSRPTEALPRLWLARAKYALANDYLPLNFYEWAVAILEWFDLERYRKSHRLNEQEYSAMANDLQIVLDGLHAYPREKLAEPWPEDQWGFG